jgi:hypothetical protein
MRKEAVDGYFFGLWSETGVVSLCGRYSNNCVCQKQKIPTKILDIYKKRRTMGREMTQQYQKCL